MKPWQRISLIIAGNLLCILALSLPILLLNKYAAPQVRGFDPADSDIALNWKPNTISGEGAVLGAIGIFCAVALPVEFLIANVLCKRDNSCLTPSGKVDCSKLIVMACRVILPLYGVFWASMALNGVVTDLIKYMVARPRPCFLDMCKPNYTVIAQPECSRCGASQSVTNPFWPMCPGCPFVNSTVAETVCEADDDWWKNRDKWLSFPSGHSSYTFYAMAYCAMYIHIRLGSLRVIYRYFVALRPLLVFVSMIFAIWVGLSRVADHRHRVSDVLAGAIIGASIGIWSFLCVTLKAVGSMPGWGRALISPSISSSSSKSRNSNETGVVVLKMDDSMAEAGIINASPDDLTNPSNQHTANRPMIRKNGSSSNNFALPPTNPPVNSSPPLGAHF